MSTEREVEAAATMLETWAASLRKSSSQCRWQVVQGDPNGKGIDYLNGCADTYLDVADALQASADHARGKRPDEGPLRAVPTPSEEKEA